MYWHGHVGTTLAIAGPLTAIRAHRALDQLDQSATRTERAKIVAREGELLLLMTGGTILVDKDIRYLKDHRRLTHSVFTAIGMRGVCDSAGRGADAVVDQVPESVKRRAAQFGRQFRRRDSDESDRTRRNVSDVPAVTVVDEGHDERKRRLAGEGRFLGNGIAAGILLHIVGDIPTKGQGGSALQALWPILKVGVNLGWIASGNPFVNQTLYVVGVSVTLVSVATLVPRLLAPTRAESVEIPVFDEVNPRLKPPRQLWATIDSHVGVRHPNLVSLPIQRQERVTPIPL